MSSLKQEIAETREIKRTLRRAWVPFFSKYGRLTTIQRRVIPQVLKGANAIVSSPTASGKTESVVAPLAERCGAEGWEALSMVYLVPTRALGNDTLARIADPLRDMGLSTALKHGDTPTLPKEIPNCLITTPESLDSLLCRKGVLLSRLRAIVLDEIHLMDGTYRGDQIRILLRRLEQKSSVGGFGTHLLSATLHDPEKLGARYADAATVISVPGVREIEAFWVESHTEIWEIARNNRFKKLLCFANARAKVETAASELTKICAPYPVFAHHGSLSRRVREEAEKAMKELETAVCVATCTLEVGIDIGDVDLVVLLDIPWSLSSLLQRIGRGNRRAGITRAAFVVQSVEEKVHAEAMLDAVRSGRSDHKPYSPDYSVAIQQMMSFAFENAKGVRESDFIDLVGPLANADTAGKLIGSLQERGLFEFRGGHYCATTKLMDMGERGIIHSNVPDSSEHVVVDTDSGKEIGRVSGACDEVFVLANQCWKILSIQKNTIKVRHHDVKGAPPVFGRRSEHGAFRWLVPRELLV